MGVKKFIEKMVEQKVLVTVVIEKSARHRDGIAWLDRDGLGLRRPLSNGEEREKHASWGIHNIAVFVWGT